MRKLIPLIMFVFLFFACSSLPKNFSYYYTGEKTGLEQIVDIGGYYVSEHGCDSLFYSVYMFYPDGLFCIATTSEVSSELIDCFASGGKSKLCQYPVWGIYRIERGLIRTQAIREEGSGFVIFRDYRITSNKELINVSDYVEAEFTNLAYIKNYPSFRKNPCEKPAKFYPLKSRRDTENKGKKFSQKR